MRVVAVPLLVAWVICLASTTCFAQAPEAGAAEPVGYRAAVEEAVGELATHHYAEARALFARAHALYPNARTHRGLGFAEFELRNYVECITQLDAALRSPVKPLEGALRTDTERLLERAQNFVARLRIDAKPRATQVVLDGAPTTNVGELVVAEGKHTLELQTAGYAAETRRLVVRGGEVQTITVVFHAPREASTDREEQTPRRRRAWLWSAAGVVVAGAAVGAVFALRDHPTRTADAFGGSANLSLEGPKAGAK